jgi:hypothetical protein
MKPYKIILPIVVVALLSSTYGRAQHDEQPNVAPSPVTDSIPPKTAITLSTAGLKLYPNPVESELRVESAKYDIDRVVIYSNASGDLVFSCSVPVPQGASIIINMSARASGYYVVRIWLKDVKKPVSCSVYKT